MDRIFIYESPKEIEKINSRMVRCILEVVVLRDGWLRWLLRCTDGPDVACAAPGFVHDNNRNGSYLRKTDKFGWTDGFIWKRTDGRIDGRIGLSDSDGNIGRTVLIRTDGADGWTDGWMDGMEVDVGGDGQANTDGRTVGTGGI